MKQEITLALDVGSQSVRSILYSKSHEAIFQWQSAIATQEEQGHIEHSAEEVLNACLEAVRAAKEFAEKSQQEIAAMGISLQRSCALLVDNTNTPLTPLLSWRDLRAKKIIEALSPEQKEKIFQDTGIPASAHFLAGKWAHLLQNKTKVDSYPLALDGYLVQRLTKTSSSRRISTAMAQRSMLLDVKTLQWSEDLCALFAIPVNLLPEICPEISDWGNVEGIPLRCVIGDQQSACSAAQSFGADALLNIGSIASLMCPVGEGTKRPPGYLFDILSCSDKGNKTFAVEATHPAPIQIFQKIEELFGADPKSIAEAWKKARIEPGYAPRSVFAPLGGLSAPVWKETLPTLLFGEIDETPEIEFAFSLLENLAFGIAFQIEDLKKYCLSEDTKILCGGGYSNILPLLECITSITSCEILQKEDVELSALGAAILASSGEALANKSAKLESLTKKVDSGLRERYETWLRLRAIALGAEQDYEEDLSEIEW